MQKQVVAKQETDQFEWERFVSLLQNERQHFALVKSQVKMGKISIYIVAKLKKIISFIMKANVTK